MKKILIAAQIALLCSTTACQKTNTQVAMEDNNDEIYMLLGNYAKAEEQGILVYKFNQETAQDTLISGDGISIHKVNPESGELTRIGYQPTGRHPRNFAITPNGKYVLVACMRSNEVQIYERNAETGLLKDTGKRISHNAPVCIKFIQ